jgi:hypothetical protein
MPGPAAAAKPPAAARVDKNLRRSDNMGEVLDGMALGGIMKGSGGMFNAL